MARLVRASLLKTALGVALATLAAVSPAAAATGGAAPSAAPETAGGGAAPMAAAAGSSGSGTAGGAAAGAEAPSSASSRQTGGAAAGARPPQRAVPRRGAAVRRQAKPRRQAPRRGAARRGAARRGGATIPPVADPATVAGVFPVSGSTWTFGGEGSRFGAGRPGHIHQGQDVSAPNGTPLVAPVAGTVTWKANQPGGAGIYIVVRGAADGRDYVFMHLKSGSVVVAPGQTVAAGEALAQVGSTGASSGPHLHFEIWVGGWQADGGAPVDPLPQLQRWAAGPA